jgi:hypothetical protein
VTERRSSASNDDAGGGSRGRREVRVEISHAEGDALHGIPNRRAIGSQPSNLNSRKPKVRRLSRRNLTRNIHPSSLYKRQVDEDDAMPSPAALLRLRTLHYTLPFLKLINLEHCTTVCILEARELENQTMQGEAGRRPQRKKLRDPRSTSEDREDDERRVTER